MKGGDWKLLKGVSRSFYLSLRLLPGPMRQAAGIAYLLARAGDTIADSAKADAAARSALLGNFRKAIEGSGGIVFEKEFLNGVPDARERHLLERLPELLGSLERMEPAGRDLIRRTMGTILEGQLADLTRFGNGVGLAVMEDRDALWDYAWKVAGCVGVFWTDLGFLTMGGRFSGEEPVEMRRLGAAYGAGLQLVNILRDLPEDLAGGRCYLPVSPADGGGFAREYGWWLEAAEEKVRAGHDYARKVKGWRLRSASGLPGMLADETLRMLESVFNGAPPVYRVKIPRGKVYGMLARSALGRMCV